MPSRILPFASCSGLPKKLYKFKGNKKKKLRSAVSGDVVFCLNQLLVKLATCVSKARLHYIPSKRGSETTLLYVYIWRVHHNATKWYYCENFLRFGNPWSNGSFRGKLWIRAKQIKTKKLHSSISEGVYKRKQISSVKVLFLPLLLKKHCVSRVFRETLKKPGLRIFLRPVGLPGYPA